VAHGPSSANLRPATPTPPERSSLARVIEITKGGQAHAHIGHFSVDGHKVGGRVRGDDAAQ